MQQQHPGKSASNSTITALNLMNRAQEGMAGLLTRKRDPERCCKLLGNGRREIRV
jgi:hypothetical protein